MGMLGDRQPFARSSGHQAHQMLEGAQKQRALRQALIFAGVQQPMLMQQIAGAPADFPPARADAAPASEPAR